ncbi:uncharacterized protein [Garra rufa]|uniref:uncharacterized protein n=1 Tax=Garra rufa TaxID=137080 RepID=UPI003CCE85BE
MMNCSTKDVDSFNSSDCSTKDVDTLTQKLDLVIYVPVLVFGLPLNIAALVVFCQLLRKWTESTIYMTNLALMDLLLLLQLPFKMHAAHHKWAEDKMLFCSFLESLYFVAMYGSIYTIACIAIDRYIAINHPFRAKQLRSKKNAMIVCSFIWVFVMAATSPIYTFREEKQGNFTCFHRFSNKGWSTAIIVCLEVFGFLLPAAVLVACSVQSVRTLNASDIRDHKRKAGVRIIYSGLAAFLVPFTPCHLAILLQYFVRNCYISDCKQKQNIALFIQVSINIANVTCCLDALCYYFIAKEVRSTKDTLKLSISRARITSSSDNLLTFQTEVKPRQTISACRLDNFCNIDLKRAPRHQHFPARLSKSTCVSACAAELTFVVKTISETVVRALLFKTPLSFGKMPPNNTENCSTSHFRYPLFTSTYSIVLLLGLPMNLWSLWILVCRNGLKKSVPVIYMANLALSDLLFTLSLPFRIFYFATGKWTLGNMLCMIPGTLFAVNIYSSSLFITLISVDRMLAVVYPLRSRHWRTVPMASVCCVMVWLIIIGLAVPTALNHPQNMDKNCNVMRCFEKYSETNWKYGFVILCFVTFFGILIPFCIILGCTVAVVRQLKGYSMATSSCNSELSKSKIVKLFLSNLLIYAVCFIPFHIAFILFGLKKLDILHGNPTLEVYFNLQTVTMCMASTNSCLDPLIYYFSTKTIKGRVRCDSSSKTVGLGLVQSMSWNGQ